MVINHAGGENYSLPGPLQEEPVASKAPYRQDPIAVVGLANRLPGHSTNPSKLWEFLERGGVAENEPPASRWSLKGHYDASGKPHTVRTPGAMFVEDIDPADFDPGFFNISTADAIAIDPQQRQLLEVVYEAMENAGLSLESLNGAPYGCFVGSYAVDYQDMQMRDPEDRVDGMTIGVGRAILSNRISHFLNLSGASMTIDTACSGSLVSVDVACRFIQTGQVEGAIVAGANLYLSPDQNQDMGAMRAASSASGRCHTFDAKADGYCKGEAINAVILKRLDAALRDGDPIRAIIRGTATNSDGWTPGIASPNGDAQVAAMRAAFAAASITNMNEVGYLEAHGTGTLAGDPIEVAAAAAVFSPTRPANQPLIIGSIKSNIGHSEPAAGVSGLIKAVLAVEKGIIPGNPTFIDPNPKIDFEGLKVKASRVALPWPKGFTSRVASVNSFGYGGSNAHVVIQDAGSFLGQKQTPHVSSFAKVESFFDDDVDSPNTRPQLLTFSANDDVSLKKYIADLQRHLLDPRVKVQPSDLAHTLAQRSSLFTRGFLLTDKSQLDDASLVTGKRSPERPRVGFVFTGQGAQWSQMGKGVVDLFPQAKQVLEGLDSALQSLPQAPTWSLLKELVEPRSPEHLRQPEFSQPLVTALQLVLVDLLKSWGIQPESVVGHSSGEIAAACAAGLLTSEDAIKIAFFRGQAAKELAGTQTAETGVGMMAVGLGAEDALKYIAPNSDTVQIACFNSSSSVTLSGKVEHLNEIKDRLEQDSHFARLLQVNLAYHSKYMAEIGDRYISLLQAHCGKPPTGSSAVKMFSSVLGSPMLGEADPEYWKTNMVSPVRFNEACSSMLSTGSADFLIELGPSGALAGPISQIKKSLSGDASNATYVAASKRGPTSALSLFDVAGRLFIAGGPLDLSAVNRNPSDAQSPALIVDLPNYAWNHQTKYWYESEASKEWRYRPFPHHDLLGSKILNSPWSAPTFRKTLDLSDLPWLLDHKMGTDIVFPASGFCAMAIEAIYQCTQMTQPVEGVTQADQLRYRLRNVRFDKALVLEEGLPAKVTLTLTPHPGTKDSWYDFRVASSKDGNRIEHSHGLIRTESHPTEIGSPSDIRPLQHPTKASIWYKAQEDAGYGFGPCFQTHQEIESVVGQRQSRSHVSLEYPPSKWSPQSLYPLHPASIDACFQTVTPALVAGKRTVLDAVLVPAIIDDLVINPNEQAPKVGLANATSEYTGKGRREENKNYFASSSVYNPETGALVVKLTGLHFHRLEANQTVPAQTYIRSAWKPDITFLTSAQIQEVHLEQAATRIESIIELASHKKPTLTVLEANLARDDVSSWWLQSPNLAERAACRQYLFASSDPNSLVAVQEQYKSAKSASFDLLDLTRDDLPLRSDRFDLIIVKHDVLHPEVLATISRNVKALLAPAGHALVIETFPVQGNQTLGTINGHTPIEQIPTILREAGFQTVVPIPSGSVQWAYLCHDSEASTETTSRAVHLIRLGPKDQTESVAGPITDALAGRGWKVVEHGSSLHDLPVGATTIVLDELSSPVLTTVQSDQWDAIKELVLSKRTPLLWVTKGSQFEVTHPDNALVHGLFRTIRAEDPSVRLTTLDVETAESSATFAAIHHVLDRVCSSEVDSPLDSEYAERGGVIYVSRLFADDQVNAVQAAKGNGAELQVKSLHDLPTTTRLRAERLGTLDALHYGEVVSAEQPVRDGCVEVEIYAAGLNFKDVAVTMGIVPENEHLLGLEGAGIVRRVGSNVQFKVGDRVVVFEKGCFANRIEVTKERTHLLPDSLSFEDAASLTGVYLTSLYCLYHLAHLQKGQSVLIHSAAGGIGISSIELAQYKGAEIYVTVGTEDKRNFLHEKFGIPYERMFSSRTTQFSREILAATNGKGIDVILNSLTGDLLDESWRICADGGIMVEIGKKDVLDRNKLSMEPFDRNCSFRALDFSHKSISDALIANLLHEIFVLYDGGYIHPVHPIKSFPFDNIPAAFAYMRSGRHIGKIVISSSETDKIEVPVRPVAPSLQLNPSVSYLIVGGLRGLCGSLAIHLAAHGAKHIIALSRSGIADERSQSIVKSCAALGCAVSGAAADVSDAEAVLKVFQTASVPIGGIIQGAMLLRDKPYEIMTVKEYHETISSKVQGTWNLHRAALQLELPLEFFTLLSSISGVVGQKGQANYAAANAFLDAFALYRLAQGLPANSTNLGVIEDVGYVAEQGGMQQHFDKTLWTGINERTLHEILELSIWQQQTPALNPASAAQLVTGIAVPLPQDADLTRDARFSPLLIQTDGETRDSGAGNDANKALQAFFLLLKSGADAAALRATCVEAVNERFTKMLRLTEPMEPGKSLSAYGLDSLSAVEFRNWLRSELGAELSTLEVTSASSLFALCDKIIGKLTKS
ncbi:Acyl transferase/acyl hydrolase/lysophospholipase [Penicillium concentricum]|uniref:Acyl transferase/acyl hydrolase/lysophospholipase n=1 Tax=Penicillium concentricum TaxID=293559 RepID=A0A9W9SC04_9EURO|nr:Acyl transferase/acyl hydrolase/lysophospholipase [Penicillium concentricum]KAJ5375590.1 Acyl transferase/acyl hydrolase/lysophospholipase [Penicillium concentricum]